MTSGERAEAKRLVQEALDESREKLRMEKAAEALALANATWDSAVDREMAQVRVASHETAVTVTAPIPENAAVTVSVNPKKPSSEASDFLNGLFSGIGVGGVATLLIVWVLMLVFKVV